MSRYIELRSVVASETHTLSDLPHLVRQHRELGRQIDSKLGRGDDYGELCALAQQAARLRETISRLIIQKRQESRGARRVLLDRGAVRHQARSSVFSAATS